MRLGHIGVLVLVMLAGCGVHHVEPGPSDGDPGSTIRANDARGVWMAVRPTQCSPEDAWRRDWIDANGGARYPIGQDTSILIEYCSKRGIWVMDSTVRDDPGAKCAACTCAAHHIVFLLVSEADAMMVAEFGGKPALPSE